MTSFDRFERSLPTLFDELATPRVPDYTDDLLARTAATRQRPAWAFPERWISMSALTQRLAAAPRIPWRLGAIVALLAILALVGVLVAGSILNRGPSPYGLAANGRIAFLDRDGRVLVGDPSTGLSTAIGQDAQNSDPLFSQDGSRVFYLHHTSAATVDLVVASVDGSVSVTLNSKPIANPNFGGWAADGTTFLIVSAGGELLAYDTSKTAEPRRLAAELDLGGVSVGLGYNFRSTHAFRPPTGNEILASTNGGQRLVAIQHDGAAYRTILDPATSPIAFTRLKGAEWSPDGARIAVLLQQAPYSDRWHAFVLNADGTGLKPLGSLGANPQGDQTSLLWSPDGTRLAYQYWIRHTEDDGQDFNPIGVADVTTGEIHDVGPTVPNGYASWEWSPDGKSILEIPQDDSGEILIVDATTGLWETAPWSIAAPNDSASGDWCRACVNWQRVAP